MNPSSQASTNGPIDEAYDAWQAADAEARVLERQVDESWDRYHRRAGDAPARKLLKEAARRRQAASATLAHAIGLLHQAGLIQPSTKTRHAPAHTAVTFLEKLALVLDPWSHTVAPDRRDADPRIDKG